MVCTALVVQTIFYECLYKIWSCNGFSIKKLKMYKPFLLLLFSIVTISFAIGQKSTSHQHKTFPDEWLGVWEGTLHIYNHQNILQSIPITLENLPTDSADIFQWVIIYGEDKIKGKRDYVLKTKDKSKGHYVIDENNGILIDAYVVENKLISHFEVMGNHLTSIYERKDDQMIFEIIVNKSFPVQVSGNIKAEGQEDIPEVKSYPIIGYQKAILSRKTLSK